MKNVGEKLDIRKEKIKIIKEKKGKMKKGGNEVVIMKEDKEKKDEEWKLEKLEDGNYGD